MRKVVDLLGDVHDRRVQLGLGGLGHSISGMSISSTRLLRA